MSSGYSLGDLARRIGGRVHGDAERMLRGVATLEDAGPDDLSLLTNPRYRDAATSTRAGAILVGPGTSVAGHDRLEAPDPYRALADLLGLFYPPPPRPTGIAESAVIDPAARVGAGAAIGPHVVIEERAWVADRVTIGPGCVVGRGSRIGSDTELRPGVVLYPETRIGERCLIHSGVVLGADGFGFATSAGEHHKIPQLGRVVVEDDVEIGANSCVDRGTLGATVVGAGSKIDDLVMLAHGVKLGGGALLAAQSGIAGSTVVGERTTFAGQTGAAGHLKIGERTVVAAKSAVFGDLADGAFVAGVPAIDHREWKRSQAVFRKLPEMQRELRRLQARIEELERRTDGGD